MSSFQALLNSVEFLIIGHRGAAGLEAENTLPSFQRAVDLQCDALELDVQCGKDLTEQSPLWVIHDDTVDRTTNGRGSVSDMTESQLRTLSCSNGAQIPTLRDVVELVALQSNGRKNVTAINVELKGQATAKPVAKLLGDYPDLVFLVSSFDHRELHAFREVDQRTAVAPLFHKWQDQAIQIAQDLSACCVNVAARLATPERCRLMRQQGLAVLAYTVNSASTANKLKGMGVDGIFTDRPDLFIRE
jgi:glycerophosphoryl diester phosphodiesterase